MLSKYFLSCFCLHIILYLRCFNCRLDYEKSQANLNILKNVATQTDTLREVTHPIDKINVQRAHKCVQVGCTFICSDGHSSEIARDINATDAKSKNKFKCLRIGALRLQNYYFPNSTLTYGFLGSYSDKVEVLYLIQSNITDIAAGAFANGTFVKIYLHDLQLTNVNKDMFRDISSDFQGLSVVQKEYPLQWVNDDFLNPVKYRIRYLTMQVGLPWVRNLTGSASLLNNLICVDFSHNNFGQSLMSTEFSQLSLVKELNLSHSRLEHLPPYIFAELLTTLAYLDLSHNRLKTLSRFIFGWHCVSRDTKIYANDNPWVCSCTFQVEIKDMNLYEGIQITCSEPDIYKNLSVFDKVICKNIYSGGAKPTTGMFITATSNDPKENVHSTTMQAVPTKGKVPLTSTALSSVFTIESKGTNPDTVECLCHFKPQSHDFMYYKLKLPPMKFDVIPHDQLKVRVETKIPFINESFGLIWFSKVTTKSYKMEINYNEYGMGCYNSISYATIVDDLKPNMAYTFCMVLRAKMTISPFSCKSIHVPGNANAQHSTVWLSRDKKATGLSLLVFGIVLFSFAGILLIYLLLKRKPILLKGSKRVTTPGGNRNYEDIVVLPRAKSIKALKEKEQKLAKRSSSSPFCNVERRRTSADSVATYESYINTNLYEVIPAHMKFQNTTNLKPSAATSSSRTSIIFDQDKLHPSYLVEDCNYYITPLRTTLNSADLVEYAEIPYRSKRISSDPLPEIPADQEPYRGILLEGMGLGYPDVGVIYMLDSQV